MKTYTKPATQTVSVSIDNMIAASPLSYDKSTNTLSGTLQNDGATEDALTRKHHGIGGGLWEDMK